MTSFVGPFFRDADTPALVSTPSMLNATRSLESTSSERMIAGENVGDIRNPENLDITMRSPHPKEVTKINFSAIIISILVLFVLLSWFDVVNWYYNETFPIYDPNNPVANVDRYLHTKRRFFFAIGMTLFCVLLIMIIFKLRFHLAY